MIKASTLSTDESLCFWLAYNRKGVLSLGLQQFGIWFGVCRLASLPNRQTHILSPKPYTLNSLNPKLRT